MLYAVLGAVLATLPGDSLYLDATSAEESGNYVQAADLFQECAATDPDLAPYAAVRYAKNLARLGRLKDAIDVLGPLIAEDTGPWSRFALYHRGLLRIQAGQVAGAADIEVALSLPIDLWWMDRYRWDAAETFLTLADARPTGYAYFRQVVDQTPYFRTRIKAAEVLAESNEPGDRLAAALGYVRARHYRTATQVAAPLSADQFQSAESRARWLYLRGALDWSEGRRTAGGRSLTALADDHPESSLAPAAMQYLIRLLAARQEFDNAETALRDMRDRFGATQDWGQARLYLANRYLRADRQDEAETHFEAIIEEFRGTALEREALLDLGDSHHKAQDWRAAMEYYDRLWKLPYKGRDSFVAAYKYGESAMAATRVDAALSRYQDAGQIGLSHFYGHRARAIVTNGTSGKAALRTPHRIPESVVVTIPRESTPIQPAPAADARLARLEFFSAYGLPEAEWEMAGLIPELMDAVDPRYYRAVGETGNAYSAMQIADAIDFGESGNGLQTTERLRIRYPRAYWSSVRALGGELNIDPYLVLSVARQESTYRPALQSHAGASGVMQLMPATANWLVGADDRIQQADAATLMRPVNSLRLGAVYLSRMLERYDGNVIYALAAYNAGPGNCDKWRRRNGHMSSAEFIEAIPFSETRDYVKRVLANYMTYHSIYDTMDWNAS